MNKYNVGDKFVIEIGEIFRNNRKRNVNKDECLYRINGFRSLVFDRTGLDNLQEYGTVRPSEWNEYLEEQYNKGLNDMWEVTKKLITTMVADDFAEVFGKDWSFPKIMDMTPREVRAAFEAYEKEQEEIKVGDVVRFKTSPLTEVLITATERGLNGIHLQTDETGRKGETNSAIRKYDIEKTGKHIDIQSILA